jgi:hypothetical protein
MRLLPKFITRSRQSSEDLRSDPRGCVRILEPFRFGKEALPVDGVRLDGHREALRREDLFHVGYLGLSHLRSEVV